MIYKILKPPDKDLVKEAINNLKSDKTYTVEIKQIRSQRSIDQNRLYWLWLSCIEDETGQDKEDVHEFFKSKFLGVSEKETFGHKFFIANTTTKLDTKEFKQYLDRIQIFSGQELQIELPDPEDLKWLDFYNKYKNYI